MGLRVLVRKNEFGAYSWQLTNMSNGETLVKSCDYVSREAAFLAIQDHAENFGIGRRFKVLDQTPDSTEDEVKCLRHKLKMQK